MTRLGNSGGSPVGKGSKPRSPHLHVAQLLSVPARVSGGARSPPSPLAPGKRQQLSGGWIVDPPFWAGCGGEPRPWVALGAPRDDPPGQGSTLERQEPEPKVTPRERKLSREGEGERAQLDCVEQNEGGAPPPGHCGGLGQRLASPSLPPPPPPPASGQGCHQTHGLPSSEMNSAPSNYSSSSFPSSVYKEFVLSPSMPHQLPN